MVHVHGRFCNPMLIQTCSQDSDGCSCNCNLILTCLCRSRMTGFASVLSTQYAKITSRAYTCPRLQRRSLNSPQKDRSCSCDLSMAQLEPYDDHFCRFNLSAAISHFTEWASLQLLVSIQHDYANQIVAFAIMAAPRHAKGDPARKTPSRLIRSDEWLSKSSAKLTSGPGPQQRRHRRQRPQDRGIRHPS